MAKTPVSDEEVSLRKKARRRLVGAIVLVLLMVVFVPMFLDREPRPRKQDIEVSIPAVPGPTSAPKAPNLPPPPSGTPNEPPAPASQPAAAEPPPAAAAVKPVVETPAPAPEPTPAPPPPPEKPAAKPAAKPVVEAPEPPAKSEPKGGEQLVIQLGAFSDARNARHLLEKVKAEKIPAYVDTIKTPRGERTRVRAGPYANMAAAERGLARLKTLKLIPGGDAKISPKGE